MVLRSIAALLLFVLPAAHAQNVARVVPTAADLVGAPPETFASSPTYGSTNFLSIVTTTGDSTAGTGGKTWRWSGASTASTNTAAANGPIAYPWGSTSGRWLNLPGLSGTNGIGIPAGGAAGQILTKTSGTDFAAAWSSPEGGGEVVVLNSMAELDAAIATGVPRTLYYLRGFHATRPGIGAGFWFWSPTATNTVSPGVRAPEAGGRIIPVCPGGRIDPSRFGAYPGFTLNNLARTADDSARIAATTAGLTAAVELSGDPLFFGSLVELTEGFWETDDGIEGTEDRRLIIEGPGRAGDLSESSRADRFQGGAVIRRMNFNGAIITLSPEEDRISRLALEFYDFTNETHTNACAIRSAPNTRAFKHLIEDITIRYCSYGIYLPSYSNGASAPNNVLRNIRIFDHSICAIWNQAPGTVNVWSQIYIQNEGYGSTNGTWASISGVAFSGSTLTVTLAWQPANLTVGSMVTLQGLPTFYAGAAAPGETGGGSQFVITAISGNAFTLQRTTAVSGSLVNRGTWSSAGVSYAVNDLVLFTKSFATGGGPHASLYTCREAHVSSTNDPPDSAKWSQAIMVSKPSATSLYPTVYIGRGVEVACSGLDIELNRAHASGSLGAMGLYVQGVLECDYLHAEYFNPGAQNNIALVRNHGGLTTIGTVYALNFGLNSGLTCSLFKNENDGAYVGEFKVGTTTCRDLASVGGTWLLASSGAGADPVNVSDYVPQVTLRVNATSTVGPGNATSFLRTVGVGGAGALGQSGILSVTNGVLQTPTTLAVRAAAEAPRMRTAIRSPDYFRDYRPVVGTFSGNWGSTEGNTGTTQAVTTSTHVIAYDCTELQFAWTGFRTPGTFSTPTEVGQNPYEILASWAFVQSDLTTLIGSKRPIFWEGRRLFRVNPGSTTLSTPAGGFFPKGSIIKVWNYTSRLKSDTNVIGGDLGTLTADQTFWPRHESVGGALQNQGLTGMESSASTTIDATLWGKVDGGTAAGTGSPGGNPPSYIVGRVLSPTSEFNEAPPVALAGMSITTGVGDLTSRLENFSGLGWLCRAIGNTRPWVRGSQGGDGLQWRLGSNLYNWMERGRWLKRAPVVVVDLGTNDAQANFSVAQIQAWLTEYWGILRKMGARKIVGVTILPRRTSFDGWQTTNQIVLNATFDTTQQALNAWLPSQVGIAGGIDALIDPVPAVSEPGWNGLIWKRSTPVATNTAAAGSTTSTINLVNAVTSHVYVGSMLLVGTNVGSIWANSTTTLSVTGIASAPGAGTNVVILDTMSNDGIHLSGRGHAAASGVLATNLSILSLAPDALQEISFGE
jgi:lysophospholipase L1-like esterase